MRQRVVVVTGASAGLGRAIVGEFARDGASIGLLARGGDGLEAAAKEVEACGGRALPLSIDLADWDAVSAAADRIESELGPIDVWVNDAMASVFVPFKDVAIEDFHRATEVTYLGTVHGTKAALDHMLPRGQGVIVQVGSALAFRSIPLQSAYCGAKHAVAGFTESLRTELLHDRTKVRVTSVHMPAMNTPQFDWVRNSLPHRPQPVPPIYQPEVAARAVLYAADHPRRRAYYVGASTTLTVLGNKIVPALLDRYLARTGYSSQQTDEAEDPGRPDNLYRPFGGDHGAHGRFDSRSHSRSAQVWLTTHRPLVAAGLATLATSVSTTIAAIGRLRRSGHGAQHGAQLGAHDASAAVKSLALKGRSAALKGQSAAVKGGSAVLKGASAAAGAGLSAAEALEALQPVQRLVARRAAEHTTD